MSAIEIGRELRQHAIKAARLPISYPRDSEPMFSTLRSHELISWDELASLRLHRVFGFRAPIAASERGSRHDDGHVLFRTAYDFAELKAK